MMGYSKINGLLSSFRAKLIIVYELGIINDLARDDLEIVREMRNSAAHCTLPFDFESPAVSNYALLIRAAKDVRYELEPGVKETRAGFRYVLACRYYAVAIGNYAKRARENLPQLAPVTPASEILP